MMTAMLAHYRELFARVRRYPGMFGVHTYRELAAYVDGCDAGTSQLLLEGFHEWLQLRLGQYSPFRWSGIVLQMAVPGWDPQGPRQLPKAQEAAAGSDALVRSARRISAGKRDYGVGVEAARGVALAPKSKPHTRRAGCVLTARAGGDRPAGSAASVQ
jgi:hypothetical protein